RRGVDVAGLHDGRGHARARAVAVSTRPSASRAGGRVAAVQAQPVRRAATTLARPSRAGPSMNAIVHARPLPAPAPSGGQLARRLADRYSDRVTGQFPIPGRAPDLRPLPRELPPALAAALQARGIRSLYAHQARAWEAARAGRHVVVATPTASGKSLCYTLPVVSAALEQGAKALYLFPTKALAQDQVAELLELNKAGDLGLRAATFDGDTPGDARQAIRLHGDVVVSNPDMLHQAILPHHTKWA